MALELPETPNIDDIKLIFNREKVHTEIINSKDDMIEKLDNKKFSLQKKFEQDFQNREFDIEFKYQSKIKSLKKNNHLHKIINKFHETVKKIIYCICHKFGIGESKELVKTFEDDTHTFIYPVE